MIVFGPWCCGIFRQIKRSRVLVPPFGATNMMNMLTCNQLRGRRVRKRTHFTDIVMALATAAGALLFRWGSPSSARKLGTTSDSCAGTSATRCKPNSHPLLEFALQASCEELKTDHRQTGCRLHDSYMKGVSDWQFPPCVFLMLDEIR